MGGSRAVRAAAARRIAGDSAIETSPLPRSWPFVRQIAPAALPSSLLIPDLHDAFPAGQTPGTRLVLTQSTYQLQRWLDALHHHPHVSVVAHASRAALERGAPEAFSARGPWHRIEVEQLDGDEDDRDDLGDDGIAALRTAFAQTPTVRLAAFEAASAAVAHGDPALLLAVASVHMELGELQPAQDALERAMTLAPDWEAVHFEYGKLWLRADDLERAAERFGEAVRLMPSFVSALSNLGAALAETDRQTAAIDALEAALHYDPTGYQILNNLGVIYREQGRLAEAEAAARRVMALAPPFVFGAYNLAHALFLQGRFAEARDAYAEAHARDAQKNPIQAGRLAMSRAAAGEVERGIDEMRLLLATVPKEVRIAIAEEADAILDALLALPGLPTQRLLAFKPLLVAVSRGGR